MDLLEAIKQRHSVRKYRNEPIDAARLGILSDEIRECNSLSGLNIQLVKDEPLAFSTGIFKYGAFSGVKNYIVMAGPHGTEYEQKVGYYGERLVLLAQTIGLNTCWVGLTFKLIEDVFTLSEGEKVHCVIAIGFGENSGKQHPDKPIDKFIDVQGEVPGWFLSGVEAALLAPTALNQQKWHFTLKEGNKVEATTAFSLTGRSYLHIDLGIVKYHFEIGAGKENFEWV